MSASGLDGERPGALSPEAAGGGTSPSAAVPLAALALVLCVLALVAGCGGNSQWPAADRDAFVEGMVAQVAWEYKHPRAYANCLLGTAQKTFGSYQSFLDADDARLGRWLHDKGVRHCIVAYGEKIWDSL